MPGLSFVKIFLAIFTNKMKHYKSLTAKTKTLT